MRRTRHWLLLILTVLTSGIPYVHGSQTPRHWAYRKPVRPALPAVQNATWPRNPLDRFIGARLETEGLQPSGQADRASLLRRVYLDLIGLPPTPARVEAFLADTAPDAYERIVDQLLDSPAYGEKWATPWLDLARYADSNGFQRDGFRDIWAYRDWVIDAMNADMPFDRFTVEQIAGDLLPGATLDQQIATGFHRNTTVNVEAGTDPEEDRYKQVVDRANTTATVFLGTTLECAQCHDHKYDPFSQAEYFQLFAYFNQTAIESRRQGPATLQFESPSIALPITQQQQVRLARLTAHQADLQQQIKGAMKGAEDEPKSKELRQRLANVEREIQSLRPTSLVMQELAEPRETFVMKRGEFLNPLDRVEPGVPGVLHPLPADAPANRLGLARWLTHPDNPLIGRVTVNRWWAEFFGHGLVATPEDFGSQGERPTHPQLLDWLAVEFIESGWSMKRIHRLIVTSATYQQDSRFTRELLARDPENRLYTRGPRLRLAAETIRDQALAAAGTLSRKMHGPPVFPPQPPDIWRVTGLVDNTYRTSEGDDRYRRGVYTIRRRSGPYPSFANFDAPDRAACVVQRVRSNTPLQALTLMNDEVYVEAALAIARRVRDECASTDPDAGIGHAFRLVLARPPTAAEVQHLRGVYEHERRHYTADPSATALLQEKGDARLAAWFHVATILLNLDETVSRN